MCLTVFHALKANLYYICRDELNTIVRGS